MLNCQKDLFNLDPGVHYLNCAYMSPLLQGVEEAGLQGLAAKRNPYKIAAPDFFNNAIQLRGLIGQLVNADAERIALIPSVSYGMGIIMKNLDKLKGKKIITVQEEFPSDVYALQRICREKKWELVFVKPPAVKTGRGAKWNQLILEAIDADTSLVNLSSVHWSDGTVFELAAISKRCKEVGAIFVVDGTQSVGARPFDLEKYPVDALICAGYKWLLGPYTSGFMYLGEFFDEGSPIEESWLNREASENFQSLSDYAQPAPYRPKAARYNMGEFSNFTNLPMMIAAVSQILAWTPAAISGYCKEIARPFIKALAYKSCWVEEEAARADHLFGISIPGGSSFETISGRLREHNVYVSFRGEMIRVSPHLYNNEEDIAALIKSLDLR